VTGGESVKPETAPSAKFTYEDFVNFPDDGKRHEIIDGEHHVTPSPNLKHQAIVGNLFLSMATHLKEHPIGHVFGSPLDVIFSDLDVVEPDLQYISRERFEILTKQHVRGAPDLVIEILSPSTRRTDEITKRKLYERFGVQEYWVVDPELDAIKVYRRTAERFEKIAELSVEQREVLTTPLLPKWSIPLADVFVSPV
jgi:Uma2 family endonuclease